MDFFARLARVTSRPSRSDDARVVTTLMLECHDIPTGWLTEQLGMQIECQIEPAAIALTPMEQAINDALDATPVVSSAQLPPNGEVAEVEFNGTRAEDAPHRTRRRRR